MDVSVHLHKGDGTVAKVTTVGEAHWVSIQDSDGGDVTIFIPEELLADAEAFAESVNTYCNPPVRLHR